MAFLILAAVAPQASAQRVGTVSGLVTDADLQAPVPGVNVRLQGTTLGASTDADGRFSLNAPAGDYVLVVSFTGYTTVRRDVTVPASASVDLDIVISQDPLELDDVVVTGYSNRERRNLATSVSSIDGSEIDDIPVSSVDGALQGRSAGVTVLRSSGTPGGGVSVRVRGSTSINGSNEPLYVVDGVPVATGDFAANGAGNQDLNALSTIDTQDIESIEILKDAAATAIYGTRAANGVVLVTTRRGRAGATRVNFETSLGTSSIPAEFDVLEGREYLEILNEGTVRGYGPSYDNYFGDPDAEGVVNSNFFEDVKQTGLLQTYRLSTSGGNQTTRFLVSGNYLNEEGSIISSQFRRYNGRVNVDHTPNERTLIQANASYNRGVVNRINNDNNIYGVLTNALLSDPSVPLRDLETGELTGNGSFAFENPLASADVFNETVDTKFLGNVTLSYEPLPGLRFRGNAGLDRLDLREDIFAPSYSTRGAPSGLGISGATTNQLWILEGTANYRTLLGVHDLSLLGGVSAQEEDYERVTSNGTQFATDILIRVNNAAQTEGGSTGSENSLLSFFGNADYALANRFLATFNARVDGSSRFGADNRYAFFPGLALGWNLHEESFLRDQSFLSLLKIRGSVGRTGQQEIGNFSSLGLYSASVSYAGLPALSPSQLPNPDLRWETTTQYNAGLDFGVLGGRVSGVFDVYVKNTDDLLLERPVPSTTGFTTYDSNIGSIRNRGIEFQLTTLNVRTRDFQWETTLNLSNNENTVTELYEDEPIAQGFASRIAVDQPLGSFYGAVTDGFLSSDDLCTDSSGETCLENGTAFINARSAAGDIKFLDFARYCTDADYASGACGETETTIEEADGIVNGADQTYIGDPNPDLFGGISNRLSFKGLELNAFFQFSIGNDVFNSSRQFYTRSGHIYGTSTELRDRIQFDADGNVTNAETATLPRAIYTDPNDNDRDSDFFVEDGTYVRLKTLTVGYTVPAKYVSRIGGNSLRVYALGENLVTWTNYTGLDPEVSTFDRSNTAFGTDFFTYPQARRFVVGVQVGI